VAACARAHVGEHRTTAPSLTSRERDGPALARRLLMSCAMCLARCVLLVLVGCGVDVRTPPMGSDETNNTNDDSSDPGVDGGVRTDGGGSTTVTDARVPPPDGIPQGLAPCDEAVYHSDLAWIQRTVFDVSCSVNGCHDTQNARADLDLSAGVAHAQLVDVASTQFSGWVRVVPGSSPDSMLMVQIDGEPGPALEGYMPWGMPKLCDNQIDAIRRWIASGAPNN
jgi:hypothetical protein